MTGDVPLPRMDYGDAADAGSQAREVIAKYIDSGPMMPDHAWGEAGLLIAALRGAGFAIVPKEPTEAMLVAYKRAIHAVVEATPKEKRRPWIGAVGGIRVSNRTKAIARYRAMVDAAPSELGEPGASPASQSSIESERTQSKAPE